MILIYKYFITNFYMQLCVALLLPCYHAALLLNSLLSFFGSKIYHFNPVFLTGSRTFNNYTHAVRFGHSSTTGFHKKAYLTHLPTRFSIKLHLVLYKIYLASFLGNKPMTLALWTWQVPWSIVKLQKLQHFFNKENWPIQLCLADSPSILQLN